MKGLQIYPKWMIRFFLKSKLYKGFHIIPPLPFEFMVALKTIDYRIFNYVGYYTFHFKKKIKQKLGLYKGNIPQKVTPVSKTN